MPDHFEITLPVTKVEVDDAGRATARFNITSRLGRHARVGVEALAQTPETAAWFSVGDPSTFSLADGDTHVVDLAVQAAEGAEAGEFEVLLRAFDVDGPQVFFTPSAPLKVVVPASEGASPPPWWVFAVVGALLVGAVGFGIWQWLRPASEVVPDVVAMELAVARSTLGETEPTVHFVDGASEDSGCVLFQTPAFGEESDVIDLLVTTCPTRRPSVSVPPVVGDLCDQSFQFCVALQRDFGDDFSASDEWATASSGMLGAFLEAFTVPGEPVPVIVGLAAAEARLVAASFVLDPEPSSGCILFQHPFPGQPHGVGDTVTIVNVDCPPAAQTAAQVSITTSVSVDDFANVCEVEAAFCAAVAADPSIPGGFVDGPGWVEELTNQADIFRNAFTDPVVPDVRGQRLTSARSLLTSIGLQVQTVAVGPTTSPATPGGSGLIVEITSCHEVVDQQPRSGARVADLANPVISLSITPLPFSACRGFFTEIDPQIATSFPFTPRPGS